MRLRRCLIPRSGVKSHTLFPPTTLSIKPRRYRRGEERRAGMGEVATALLLKMDVGKPTAQPQLVLSPFVMQRATSKQASPLVNIYGHFLFIASSSHSLR